MELFTIRFIYFDKQSISLSAARATKWESAEKEKKVARVNYQAYILLNFERREAPPSQLTNGWSFKAHKCVPNRYTRTA